ncbi:hypothetical protein BLNAU_1301 [Blattamonas nauphoetae]|uniref:Outer membrane protein n=1 Tax=Blattamonas nauphoetae TaxID=2049346 RepID=A0ABQ9YJ01_9EUKA|nr:hypothetical protein BLNAU_1301 [Blattamonas nauphoetae]
MLVSIYLLSILHAAFPEVANAGTTVLVAPDISASSDTIGCGTTVMPCKSIAFGFTQLQSTSNAGYRIEIGCNSICTEVRNTLVDKPVDFYGQSRKAMIGGDGDVSELKSVLTLTSTATFDTLTLLRTHHVSFAALTGRTNVVFTACTFGFVSSSSKEKTIHPSLLKMDGGFLTIAGYALTSYIGTQSITLLNMTSGSSSISKLSTADSGPIVSENAALLIVSGGSLNITDQVFSNLTRVNSSPSVLEYKAKTIQLYMNNVTTKDCESRFRPHLISIQSESSFKEGQVIIKNTNFIHPEGNSFFAVFVQGSNFAASITPADFAGTIPSYDLLTPEKACEILGREDESESSLRYSVAQVFYPYTTGPVFVENVLGQDNKFCGRQNTPCNSIGYVFARQAEGQTSIVLMKYSDISSDLATRHKTTILKGGLEHELAWLSFFPSSRLIVKSGMLLDCDNFAVSYYDSPTDSGFVVQGSLQLTSMDFHLSGRTSCGAVNVAGGFTYLRNVTTSPVDAKSHKQLLNVSRGQVFLVNATLGGSADRKMRTDGGILVFVQSGILQIEDSIFQHIAKESEGDGGVVVSLGGTVRLVNVWFVDCTAPTRAHCVLVSRSSFSADTVTMLSVKFTDGTSKKLNESVVLIGKDIRATVNARSFNGTLQPMRYTPEADRMVLVGQEDRTSAVFPLALFMIGSNEEAEKEGEFVLLSMNENE